MKVYCVRKDIASVEYTIGIFSSFEKAWKLGIIPMLKEKGYTLHGDKKKLKQAIETGGYGDINVVVVDENETIYKTIGSIITELVDKNTYFD